jgi:hypothetical protein
MFFENEPAEEIARKQRGDHIGLDLVDLLLLFIHRQVGFNAEGLEILSGDLFLSGLDAQDIPQGFGNGHEKILFKDRSKVNNGNVSAGIPESGEEPALTEVIEEFDPLFPVQYITDFE